MYLNVVAVVDLDFLPLPGDRNLMAESVVAREYERYGLQVTSS
jgi:hypothetical protein